MTRPIFVCAVVGPTASGKTDLAVELALRNNGEVISFDSMQVYADAPIATAAPTAAERRGVPHHLIGFLPADAVFSVAKFTEMARPLIADIHSRGRLPVLVGGTGLYYAALLDNLQFTDQSSEQLEQVRAVLRERLQNEGIEVLYRELQQTDPAAAEKIHPNNHVRVLRALEVQAVTGRTITRQVAESRRAPSPYVPCVIGITYRDRSLLYDRINRRVPAMLANGLEEEVRALYAKNPAGTLLQAIGVKEFAPYFNGAISRDELIASIQTETRHYAKRQLTWFRRDARVHWLYKDEFDQPVQFIQQAQTLLSQAMAAYAQETEVTV